MVMAQRQLRDCAMGERGPQPGEGGRPPTPIDTEIVRRTAAIGCTMEEVAAVLGVPRRTLYDRMEQDPEIQRALDKGRAQGRVTLRRLQWKEAEAGNPTMLIWLGKQLLSQRDKHDVTADETVSIVGLHLIAAQQISCELVAELATRTTINGQAESPNQQQPPSGNLLDAPPALE
jgi:hypothetical protein